MEAGNAGGKCPFALQCMLHSEWDISEDFPSPCFRVVSIWTELNLEISGILYSNCLSNEVNAPVDKNALALCERRKEQ